MKVTVIVPVYNAEKYLDQSIQSVLNQDCKDFELILINDGSNDGSGDICDVYAAKDKRVKVFHKTNGGVSSARNLGIENAAGEWITFIDADDYISTNYFKVLESETVPDMILQGFTFVEQCHVIKYITYHFEELVLEEFLTKYHVYPYFSSSWSKFYKRGILQRHKIRFEELLTFGEDTLFNLNYLRFCKLIATSGLSCYCYRILNTGLTNSVYNFQHDLHLYRAFDKRLASYGNKAFYDKSIEIPLSRLSRAIYHDKSVHPAERRKILKEIVETNYNVILRIYTDPKIKVFIKVAHYTGMYSILDFVLSKIISKRI